MKGLDIGSDRVDELAAISAILLYGRQDRSAVYGTVHPVMQGKSGRATIGAGRPIDRMALVDCLRELAQNAAPKAEFLPETVLAVSQEAVMWWCRPAMRRVFFDCQEIGRRSAVVPHPGLVFRAASSGFYFAELGLKEANNMAWYGLVAPPNTPKDVVAKVNAAANRALQDPDVKRHLAEGGSIVDGGTPEKFVQLATRELNLRREIVKKQNIKLD